MFKVLTIAGTDCSGGAGVQADIKTITAHKMYAMSAIAALTAQNTTGVFDVMNVTPEFLSKQLDAIFTDIYPDAVKIGMVSDKELIKVIVAKLKEYKAKNIVVDPVMVATSGAKLLSDDAIHTLVNELFPIASLITPNILEAQALTNMEIHSKEDMELVANKLYEMTKAPILLKGGHSINDANDLLFYNNTKKWFEGNRIDTKNTHGTGCTLSSALACNLAKGYSLEESVSNAKKYISMALSTDLDLGKGSGPLNHMVKIEELI